MFADFIFFVLFLSDDYAHGYDLSNKESYSKTECFGKLPMFLFCFCFPLLEMQFVFFYSQNCRKYHEIELETQMLKFFFFFDGWADKIVNFSVWAK